MKLHRGDIVKIKKGKDAGKEGAIEEIIIAEDKVLVTGVNLFKKHRKPKGEKNPGGIITINKPVPAANVQYICKKCKQPTRLGYKIEKDGKKYRYCKKCKEIVA